MFVFRQVEVVIYADTVKGNTSLETFDLMYVSQIFAKHQNICICSAASG